MYATVLDTVAPLKAEMDILEAAAAKGQTKLNALEADAKEIEDKIRIGPRPKIQRVARLVKLVFLVEIPR